MNKQAKSFADVVEDDRRPNSKSPNQPIFQDLKAPAWISDSLESVVTALDGEEK